jgi:tetratricopeptide (TPR) repeat protein
MMPPNWRTQMRWLQYVGALKQYLLLNPGDFEGQLLLGTYYLEQNYFDLGTEHLEKAVEAFDKVKSNQTHPDLVTEWNNRRKFAENLRKRVTDRLNELERGTAREPDLKKVTLALSSRYGLVQRAQQILNNIKIAQLNDRDKQLVLFLQIDMFINTGDLWTAAGSMPSPSPGMSRDYWKRYFQLYAAIGDYKKADEALAELEKMDAVLQPAWVKGIAQNLHPGSWGTPVAEILWRWPMTDIPFAMSALAETMANRAQARVLRGILALESGDTIAAREHLEAALKIADARLPFPDRKVAERYLQLLRAEAPR